MSERDEDRVHFATVYDGLWSPLCFPAKAWTWPLSRLDEQVTCGNCVAMLQRYPRTPTPPVPVTPRSTQ